MDTSFNCKCCITDPGVLDMNDLADALELLTERNTFEGRGEKQMTKRRKQIVEQKVRQATYNLTAEQVLMINKIIDEGKKVAIKIRVKDKWVQVGEIETKLKIENKSSEVSK